MTEDTYMIIRFRFHGDNEVITRGLTLEQAQAHCRRPDTYSESARWFDGYECETAKANDSEGSE